MTIKDIIKGSDTSFVDVRTVAEFNTGHVEGAINIPLDELPERYKEIELLGRKPVVFYCRSGARSGLAVSMMHQKGFQHIYNGGGVEEVISARNHQLK